MMGKPTIGRVSPSPMDQYRRRLRLLAETERFLQRALTRGDAVKIANLRREVGVAIRSVVMAKQNVKKKPNATTKGAEPIREASEPAAGWSVDSGVRYSLDPDADQRTVWVFKTSTSFHRRDCHFVEGRDGAVQIPIGTARKRGLERCMHCVPTVR